MHGLLLIGLMLDIFVPPLPVLHGRVPLIPEHSTRCHGGLPPGGLEAASSCNSPRWLVSGVLMYAFAGCFAFFAPLAYGVPLTEEEFQSRLWRAAWR